MEPYEKQRQICRDIRDTSYPMGSDIGLYVLPFNRFIAVDDGSPGWVWLSPVNEKACHKYGKFVVRLDGDNITVGYAVERGFPPEVAIAMDCKPIESDWSWHNVMSGLRSGKLGEAAVASVLAGSQLMLYVAISPWEGKGQSCSMLIDEQGNLSAADLIPGVQNNAPAIMACDNLKQLPDVLEAIESTSYVDLQFVVTFNVETNPDSLWSAPQFHARILKNFEPWVPFPKRHL
jgi:hypothetical protein